MSVLNARRARVLPLLVLGLLLATASSAMASTSAVYTQSNGADGNVVRVFERGADGSLSPAGSVSTDGLGTGAGLGSQGAVALSDNGAVLIAVNAGSDEISSFRAGENGELELVDVALSGGDRPVSVDIRGDLAYVLNAGTPNVSGFRVGADGTLTPIAGSTEGLNAGAAVASQVSIAPDRSALVVSVRGSNRLETLPLVGDVPEAAVITASSGAAPFGFAFAKRGAVVVSEAGASTVSSYVLDGSGLDIASASLPVGQGAACWVVVTGNGRFAYTGNASGSISGYEIARDGELTALDADGLTATAPRPNDLAVSRNSRFLYAINPGPGRISAYRVAADGSLDAIDGISLPAGAAGIAAG